jgi:hypothetical protein
LNFHFIHLNSRFPSRPTPLLHLHAVQDAIIHDFSKTNKMYEHVNKLDVWIATSMSSCEEQKKRKRISFH